MKKFLFKRAADGKWIFGNKTTSICKAGLYRIDPMADGESFALYAVYNRDISLNYPNRFDEYKKENGSVYASMSDFLTATADFFDPGGVAISVTGGLTNEQLRAEAIPSKLLTASGATTTLQIATLGIVNNLGVADFSLPGNALFMLKNDGPAQVELEVKLANNDAWIATKFDPGWNPEILKAIKTNASADINLKYGY